MKNDEIEKVNNGIDEICMKLIALKGCVDVMAGNSKVDYYVSNAFEHISFYLDDIEKKVNNLYLRVDN